MIGGAGLRPALSLSMPRSRSDQGGFETCLDTRYIGRILRIFIRMRNFACCPYTIF
jgi:hypothetical protein